jgi:hypothetical protein
MEVSFFLCHENVHYHLGMAFDKWVGKAITLSQQGGQMSIVCLAFHRIQVTTLLGAGVEGEGGGGVSQICAMRIVQEIVPCMPTLATMESFTFVAE